MVSWRAACWFVSLYYLSVVTGIPSKWNVNGGRPYLSMRHILGDATFWETFSDEVLNKKTWKCAFPEDVLIQKMEKDAELYDDATVFWNRRKGVEKWIRNDSLWAETVLGACKEIASDVIGDYSRELGRYNLLEALKDYVYHLHYFREVARVMGSRGKTVVVRSQNSSVIHDIDKLDPVMLVGYSERFEDNMTTSLWDKCVDRHTHINPHHQAHCLWQNCCKQLNRTRCEVDGAIAILEMICDKVSRRVQKTLHGNMSSDMWDVEIQFYKGLSDHWLDVIDQVTEDMKKAER